jgi:hypothetical protein
MLTGVYGFMKRPVGSACVFAGVATWEWTAQVITHPLHTLSTKQGPRQDQHND